jgi:hypothetical protein
VITWDGVRGLTLTLRNLRNLRIAILRILSILRASTLRITAPRRSRRVRLLQCPNHNPPHGLWDRRLVGTDPSVRAQGRPSDGPVGTTQLGTTQLKWNCMAFHTTCVLSSIGSAFGGAIHEGNEGWGVTAGVNEPQSSQGENGMTASIRHG